MTRYHYLHSLPSNILIKWSGGSIALMEGGRGWRLPDQESLGGNLTLRTPGSVWSTLGRATFGSGPLTASERATFNHTAH